MIISKTPFRISFFGGGKDYPVWYKENSGAVLSTTIDKYCYISIRYLPPFFEHKHRIVYSLVENVKNIAVFILCGGLGKRLKKVIGNIPKPMVKIGGRPFLDILLDYLAGFGFRHFILGTGYKVDVIENYYVNNKILGLNILFSRERVPLDTGGAIKNARKFIKSNPFLVLNGD